MNKKFRTICGTLLAGITCLSAVGCGGVQNEPNTLYISVIDKGYGTEWVEETVSEFLASDDMYSGYKYVIDKSYVDSAVKTSIESGEGYCNYDLVIHGGGVNFVEDKYSYKLNDVYNSTYKDGQLKDYMNSTAIKAYKKGEDFYAMPYVSSACGLMINYDAVDAVLGDGWENTYKFRTSNELLAFVEALSNTTLVPFTLVAKTRYYSYFTEVMWAQYETLENIEMFYNGEYYNEITGYKQQGAGAVLQPGRLQAIKVLEKCFATEEYRRIYSGYDAMQTAFMEGQAAILCCGDWMLSEMGATKYANTDFRFIKTPIISALGVKLGISQSTSSTGVSGQIDDVEYTITDESKLLEIIDYIDGVTATKPSDVSDDVIAKVTAARSIEYNGLTDLSMVVPEYADDAEIVVDYLKWLYSTAGHEKYIQATGGLTLPIEYDLENSTHYANLHTFMKTRWLLCNENINYYMRSQAYKLVKGGMYAYHAIFDGPLEYLLTGAANMSNRDTAYEIYRHDYEYYTTGNNWTSLLEASR